MSGLNVAYDDDDPTEPRLTTKSVGPASATSTGESDSFLSVQAILDLVIDTTDNSVRVVTT